MNGDWSFQSIAWLELSKFHKMNHKSSPSDSSTIFFLEVLWSHLIPLWDFSCHSLIISLTWGWVIGSVRVVNESIRWVLQTGSTYSLKKIWLKRMIHSEWISSPFTHRPARAWVNLQVISLHFGHTKLLYDFKEPDLWSFYGAFCVILLLDSSSSHSLALYGNWLPGHSNFVIHRRKYVIKVWNNMRMRK